MFPQKIAGRADDTLANLDMLDKDASIARICVENCIQNLNLTSTKQFVEKRVYDEEVADKTEEKIPTSNGVRTQTDFTPKIKEALSFGLPGVKSMLSGVSARPLPYILGSEEFIDCPTAGVVYPQRLQKPVHQQSIPVPTIQSSSSHSSPHQIQDAVLEKSLSSSDVSSISSATPANSVPPSVTQPPANFRGINLQEELAARLKINPEVVTSRPPILAKPNKEQPAVSIHEPDRVKPPSLPVEPKRRNLFDDTSSGSESDSDLFKSAPAIKPPAPTILVPKEPVFQPELPKAPVITSKTNGASVPVKEKLIKGGLFGSSDSEDDLFSTSIPNRSSIKPTNPTGNDEVDDIFSSSKQATVVKPTEKKVPPAQTVQINKSKSLFMESDSDDGDLFGPVAPLQPKRPESTLSQVASTSSSRTESPDLNRYQQSTPVKQTVENGRQSNQQAAALKKPAASLLFGDDSDDEDLFSGLPVVKPIKSEIVISKPPISNAIPPAPDLAGGNVSMNVTSPPKLEAPKVTSSEKVDKSDAVPQPIVKASDPRTAATEGTKKSILFADESDDDDLFKGITPRASTKQQFSPTASHSSGPQFPAVPIFHNQITKGEVQEQAVPSIKSPQDVVKAPSSSLSTRAMTSPTGDTTEQTKPDVIISSITPTLVSQSGAIEEIRNSASMELPLPADSGAGASSPPSSTGRIAALKLSLSQQPNSLPFSTSQPGSSVTSPTDEVVTNNQSRKPFGGVALFTPIVTNTPKTEQTVESTGSTTTSPTEEARDINQARKPFGGVALFTPPVTNTLETGQTVESTGSASTSPSDESRAKNQAQKPFGGVSLFPPPVPSTAKSEKPVESQPNKSDIDTDSLPCLAKDRPKAPAARRLPSRSFRRSQILDDQTGSLEVKANIYFHLNMYF